MLRRLLITLVLLTSACNVPTSQPSAQTGSLRAWFDAPLPGTVYTPPGACQIVAHGASPAGIGTFELSINGAVAASIPSPDKTGSLVTLTRQCGVSEPGTYLLQMRVQDNSGQWSEAAETSLIIPAGGTPSPSPVPAASTEPPPAAAPTATFTPTAPAAGSVQVERISDDLIYIGDTSCGPLQVTIVARATAPKGITVVVLFYRFAGASSSSGFESMAMNPIGGDLYQVTLNPTSLLGRASFEQATLQYQVIVQQKDGDTSLRTPVLADIAVQACGGTAPEASCSSYTDKVACRVHGCKWALQPALVPTYACVNP